MSLKSILSELRSKGDPRAAEGMARFGISSKGTLGVSVPTIRGMAKKIGKDHGLAKGLWKSGLHEARILAAMVDEPAEVTEEQMEEWARGFDSWDVVDQCCGVLFDKTPYGYSKALEWSERPEEFVRRAGFSMMAELAVHDKKAPDQAFLDFFPAIKTGSTDRRNYVKKAVNWALRQIGKRNRFLNGEALKLAEEISRTDSPSGRWVAADAIRELRSEPVRKKLSGSS